MPKKTSQLYIHALRVAYPGSAIEIFTDALVGTPMALWERENPGSPIQTRKRMEGYQPVRAIWDTGATGSVISKEIALRLGLVATGRRMVRYVNGRGEAHEYTIDIQLPMGVVFPNQIVTEGDINTPETNVHLLIGMDIIRLGDFSISNHNFETVMSFCVPPCENRVDLLERSVKRNSANGYKAK